MRHRPRFKPRRSFGLGINEKCSKCGEKLKKNNKHHFLCAKCWEEKELAKGNLALMGGVK